MDISNFFIYCWFFGSWGFIKSQLDDNQFKLCEQVAQFVYAQKGNSMVEVPSDSYVSMTTAEGTRNFNVSMTTNTITVKLVDKSSTYIVVAKPQNGELTMTQDAEIDLVFCGLVGWLTMLVTMGMLGILAVVFTYKHDGCCKVAKW